MLAERVLFKRTATVIKKNSLLLLRLDSIGDYVLFRNFIQILKASTAYKNYSITLCGNNWWKKLAENLDKEYIDQFIWIDYGKMNDFTYRLSVFKKIHQQGFEVLIHPTYSRDEISDAVVRYSGAKQRIGYDGDLTNLTAAQKKINNAAYSQLISSTSKYVFEFYRNSYFFEQLLATRIELVKPQINYSCVVENKIIICPGAKDAYRRWSPLKFAALCTQLKLVYPTHEFLICGSQQDKAAAEEMIVNSAIRFSNYTGKLNLMELLILFATAKLILTNDSGPFHIAVALNKKVICLSNGNNYGRFSPYPAQMHTRSTVIYPDALLSLPLESDRLDQFCKNGSLLDINSIEVDTVYAALKTSLTELE